MISVIIPIYNRAKYISSCIDSVLNQTYKDIEIIVVDDGSTDNLKEILIPYQNKIKYFYKENGGAASARNIGIKQAKGEYIAWLDSDDRWLNFKLDLQLTVLKKLPKEIGFIFSDISCFNDEKGLIKKSYIGEYFSSLPRYKLSYYSMFSRRSSLKELGIVIDDLDNNTKIFWGDIFNKLIYGPMFPTPAILAKKSCIDKVGLFDEKYKTAEDFDFNARLAMKYSVAFIDLPTIEYRRGHSDQLSSPNKQVDTYKAWVDIVIKLWASDNEYYSKYRNMVNWRLSHYYYSLGVAYYKKNMYKDSLRAFIESLKLNYKQKRIYVYTLVSILEILRYKLIIKCKRRD